MFNAQEELNESVLGLKGVGKRRAGLFAKLGIKTCFDLLCHFPVAYDDCSKVACLRGVVYGQNCCVKAKIIEKLMVFQTSKNLRKMEALAVDESGFVFSLVFFNNEFFFRNLKLEKFYIFFGKLEKYGQKIQMVAPKLVLKKEVGLVAKYGLVANLTNRIISSQVRQVLKCFKLKENLPCGVVTKFKLLDRYRAFFYVHFPKDEFCLNQARRRLIFEELFFWQLSLKCLKRFQQKKTRVVLKTTNLDEFLQLLFFKLSNSQHRVLAECVADCCKNVAMNRLIQGDVGCGKTVIVQALCYLFVKSGFQVAVMAPTEILARQHYLNFWSLFSKLNIKIGLLVGALKKAQRLSLLSEIARGEIQILVGTHSLFSEQTVFNKLGLVVTDEQHRFGVAQRGKLTKKGEAPHVLIMSATPVPRTLAMAVFSDVDVSIVDEMPVSRAKTQTFHIPPSKRKRAFLFLAREVAKGRQAYIVCPLIENGLKKAIAVEPYFEKLKTLKELKGIKMAMLHGKHSAEQKANLMNEFVKGEIDVLVATSMIEVGIDNPNATVIIIESAEMFGLASLHQLRGRVGRGSFNSFCVLISEVKTKQAKERMQAMCKFSNGFDISRLDLKLRGPGHFLGTLQHGAPEFKIASLIKNFDLLKVCSNEAENFLNYGRNFTLSNQKILNDLKISLKNNNFIL